jgi:mannose-6-phosphate isomerase-like protein (cupin superfamily)
LSSFLALDRRARRSACHGDDLVKTVHENESVYIPIGAVHRLENPGKILLEPIELETGSYQSTVSRYRVASFSMQSGCLLKV